MRRAHATPPADSLRREEGAGIALLVVASLLLLPLVHRLLQQGSPSGYVLAAGGLSMGLGWAAGFFLEGRRVWIGRAMAALGVVAVAALLLPPVAATGLAWLLAGVAALSLVALVMLRRR